MKRGTADHPKTLMLAAELRKVYAAHRKSSLFGGKAEAVGLLELLWDWASKYAIQGDIGKWPDDVIAQGIGWRFSGKELISCMISSGWIDKAAEPCRLVLHDIKDHATNLWRQNLQNAGLTWWDGSDPRRWKLQKSPNNLQKKSNHTPQAKPEPEAEPITTSSTPSVVAGRKPEPAICAEDGFAEFRSAAEQYGISGSEPDWEEARRFAWARLDFHSRLAAVRGIAERIQAGAVDDPARNALPKNYLLRRMWERKIRSPAPTSGKSEATAVALVGVLQRELQANDKVQLTRSGGGARLAGNAQVLALRPRDEG